MKIIMIIIACVFVFFILSNLGKKDNKENEYDRKS